MEAKLRIGALAAFAASCMVAAVSHAAVPGLRLYVLDGGVLESDPARYHLRPDEVSTTQLSIGAFLIVHPKGTLLWDTGAISDDTWTPTGGPVVKHLVLSNGNERTVTLRQPLRAQLAAIGVAPKDITYLALSHFHWDHVANANAFAASTWLARKSEHDLMFPMPSAEPPQPSTFAALGKARTILVADEDYDVFGDHSVVIKPATGHTPGHSVLYVDLPRTGGVVLAGDLYHYPEERSLKRLPTADFDVAQTERSRQALEAFLARTGARLWIQHDLAAFRQLKKAPDYYD